MEPSEEIDLADTERKRFGEGEPLPYTIKQILEWRAEFDLGYNTGEVLPLVVRRELYWGLDENCYLHHDFWALYFVTHFSRNHFTQLFTREVGVAPATYLRHLRLQHAQNLLRETLQSTNDIAQLCGFSDATAFVPFKKFWDFAFNLP